MPRITATDASEQELLDNVQDYGWHCMNVFGDELHEGFSYTVGLFHTYGHPELLIYGLPSETAHAIFCIAVQAAERGASLNLSQPTDELIEGYSCVFVPVPLFAYADHVGFAAWYYEGPDFPVQQIVWPSRTGHFPWHPEASAEFRAKQPVLGYSGRGT